MYTPPFAPGVALCHFIPKGIHGKYSTYQLLVSDSSHGPPLLGTCPPLLGSDTDKQQKSSSCRFLEIPSSFLHSPRGPRMSSLTTPERLAASSGSVTIDSCAVHVDPKKVLGKLDLHPLPIACTLYFLCSL